MGIQINGQNDNISATDGGLTISDLEINQSGISTFNGSVIINEKIRINPDDASTTWQRENKNLHQIRDDVYVEGTVNLGDKAGFDATPLGITTFAYTGIGTTGELTVGIATTTHTPTAHAIAEGKNILIKDSASGFQEAYNTLTGSTGLTIKVARASDPSSQLSIANTKVVVYTPADPRGCLNVAKDYAKFEENTFNPILRGFVGASTTHPVGINTEVFKIQLKRDSSAQDSVATLLHSTREMGSKQRLALTIDDGDSYPDGKSLVLTQTGVKITNLDDFTNAKTLLEVQDDAGGTLTLSCSDDSSSADQLIGKINFHTADPSGDGPQNNAIISAHSVANTGSGAYIKFSTATGATGSEGADAVERVRIASDGAFTLKPEGDVAEAIRIAPAVDASTQQEFGIGLAVNSNHTHPAAKITFKEFDASDSRGDLLFYTRGSNTDSAPNLRMTLNSSGMLNLFGGGSTLPWGASFPAADGNNSTRCFFTAGTTARTFSVMQENGKFRISGAGTAGTSTGNQLVYLSSTTATSWTGGSDIRLKENITEIPNVLDKIKNYRCARFNFIGDDASDIQNIKFGFIAQDWVDDFPEVLSTSTKDADDPTDTTEYYGMQYTETIPVLLKAIQELNAKNDALEARISTLESS